MNKQLRLSIWLHSLLLLLLTMWDNYDKLSIVSESSMDGIHGIHNQYYRMIIDRWLEWLDDYWCID